MTPSKGLLQSLGETCERLDHIPDPPKTRPTLEGQLLSGQPESVEDRFRRWAVDERFLRFLRLLPSLKNLYSEIRTMAPVTQSPSAQAPISTRMQLGSLQVHGKPSTIPTRCRFQCWMAGFRLSATSAKHKSTCAILPLMQRGDIMFNVKRAKLASVAVIFLAVGCRGKTDTDTANFKTAINDYYRGRQECVWTNPIKFPAQADASKDDQTKGLDALTDSGLLTRTAEEKKRFLIGSKQVSNYDVSDKGRATWTVDPSQPGYGNFCFGHREVSSIGTFTTAPGPNGANVATVNYQYQLASVPAWAQSPEIKTAFPNVQAALAGTQSATEKLTQTPNGWIVSPDQTTP